MKHRARGDGSGPRIVFGLNPIRELLASRPGDVERLFLAEQGLSPQVADELSGLARGRRLPVERARRDALDAMAEGGVHQGVVAHVKPFHYRDLDELLSLALASNRPPLIVVLDGVQDPQNFGAIVRSAWAFGAHGVVVPQDRAAQVTGAVVKASAGAIELCPVARVVNLARAIDTLKEANLWTVAAEPRDGRPLHQARLEGAAGLVIGAEGQGVRQNVAAHCDDRVAIPMTHGFESLNASAAAAVLLYEASRQRLAR